MRFSKTFLAAGFTASAFAAPIYDESAFDECDYEPEPKPSEHKSRSIASAVMGTWPNPLQSDMCSLFT